MAITFQDDHAGASHHAAGLKFENNGNYGLAHHEFGQALFSIKASPLAMHDKPSANLHMARLGRDDSFTYMREALQSHSAYGLTESHRRMYGSFLLTKVLLEAGSDIYEPVSWARLQSEHGATLGTLFRLSVVNAVAFDGRAQSILKPEIYISGQPQYNALDYLAAGSNPCYRLSHIMHRARYELICGNAQQAAVWAGEAACQLVIAEQFNPTYLLGPAGTLLSELPQLQTPQAAEQSVLTNP